MYVLYYLNKIHNNQLSPLPPFTRQTRHVLGDRCDEFSLVPINIRHILITASENIKGWNVMV